MVCNWSPEPPRDIDDGMSIPSQVVIEDSDESEDESLVNATQGYLLLNQPLSLDISSDEEELSDVETNNINDFESSTPPCDGATNPESEVAHQSSNELEQVEQLAVNLRLQMNVNCDEVKAVMAGFSLPLSAYPTWASNVPESQWTATLAQQIQRIQAGSSNS